ncbi:hypothetical protein BLOT_012451 [Blomia tropicalis]|nr:hypothetical protein BLOT_012451 [Blomia tropicalis]
MVIQYCISRKEKDIEFIEILIPLFGSNKNELIEWNKDKNQDGDSVLHLANELIEWIKDKIYVNELIEWIKDKNQYGDSVLHLVGKKRI